MAAPACTRPGTDGRRGRSRRGRARRPRRRGRETGVPPEMTPPPTPVPSVSITRSSTPRPAPARHSPIAAAFASLSSPTGSPKRSRMWSRSGEVCERQVDAARRRRRAPGRSATATPKPTAATDVVEQLGDRGLELGEDVLLRVLRGRRARDGARRSRRARRPRRGSSCRRGRLRSHDCRLHSGYRNPPHGRLRGEAVPRLSRRPDEGQGAAASAASARPGGPSAATAAAPARSSSGRRAAAVSGSAGRGAAGRSSRFSA